MQGLIGKTFRGRRDSGAEFTGEAIASDGLRVVLQNKRGRLATCHIDTCAIVGVDGLIFVDCGPHKINVIKVIRQHTGTGLREAKDLAERSWPFTAETIRVALSAYAVPTSMDAFRRDLAAAGAVFKGKK